MDSKENSIYLGKSTLLTHELLATAPHQEEIYSWEICLSQSWTYKNILMCLMEVNWTNVNHDLCHKHTWSTLVWWTETSSLKSQRQLLSKWLTWPCSLRWWNTAQWESSVTRHWAKQKVSLSWWAALSGHPHPLQASEACLRWHCLLIPRAVAYPHPFSKIKCDFWEHAFFVKNKTKTKQKSKNKTRQNKAYTVTGDLYPSNQVAFWSISSVLNNILSVLDLSLYWFYLPANAEKILKLHVPLDVTNVQVGS